MTDFVVANHLAHSQLQSLLLGHLKCDLGHSILYLYENNEYACNAPKEGYNFPFATL